MNVRCHPERSARKGFPTSLCCRGGAESKKPYDTAKSPCGRMAQQLVLRPLAAKGFL